MECQIDASEVKCCWKIRVVNNRKNAGNMHCKRVHLSVVIDDNGAPLIRLFVLKGCRNRVVWKGKNEEKKKKGGETRKKNRRTTKQTSFCFENNGAGGKY